MILKVDILLPFPLPSPSFLPFSPFFLWRPPIRLQAREGPAKDAAINDQSHVVALILRQTARVHTNIEREADTRKRRKGTDAAEMMTPLLIADIRSLTRRNGRENAMINIDLII